MIMMLNVFHVGDGFAIGSNWTAQRFIMAFSMCFGSLIFPTSCKRARMSSSTFFPASIYRPPLNVTDSLRIC